MSEEVARLLTDEGCLQILENGQVLVGNKMYGTMRDAATIETIGKQQIGMYVGSDTGLLTVLFPNKRGYPNFVKVMRTSLLGNSTNSKGIAGVPKQEAAVSEEEARSRLNGVWQLYAWDIAGK
jgi:hypothetical protein